MEHGLLLKYEVGLGLILLCVVLLAIFGFFAKRHKWGQKGMIAHIIQAGIMCCAVVLTSQYLQMAITDFHIKFITIQMVNFGMIILIALIVLRTLFFLTNRLEVIQVEKGADKTSAKIITRVFKIIIFFVILILFGEHFGMSLSGLLTFGGIGGIAIGMAGKDILSNFFSGIMLFFDRPFNIGDWVSSPDRQIEGTVVEIGWRITKIMTFDHRPLYIPNSVFSSISVENPGRMTNRRIKTQIGLRYQDADKVEAVVNDIRTMLKNNPKIDTKQTLLVYFDEFADSSLNILIYCFTKTVVWAEWLEAQQEVYLKMVEIVHQHGADFAFPSQTVYLDNDESPIDIRIAQAQNAQALKALQTQSAAVTQSQPLTQSPQSPQSPQS